MITYKILIKLTVIGFFLFSLTACPVDPTGDSTVTIVNNSDKLIDYYIDSSNELKVINPFEVPTVRLLKPYSKLKLHNWWLEFFDREPVRHMYLFDRAVLDTVPWDTIRHHNMYLKRIRLTKQKLDSLNWTLTYP